MGAEILPLNRCPRTEGRYYVLVTKDVDDDEIMFGTWVNPRWVDHEYWALEDKAIAGWIDFRGEALPDTGFSIENAELNRASR